MPQRKTLFSRDRDLFLGSRLNLDPQPAKLVQPAGVVQAVSQAERVADLAGQLTHLLIDLQCLVGVAEVPQGHRQIAADVDAGVVARLRGPELDALPVVELGERRREAVAGAGEICPIEHRLAGDVERFHHAAGIVEGPGKFHRLGDQLHTEPDLAADEMPLPDAHDDRDELR